MNITAWLVFIGAAVLEVTGDAVVRRGLRGRGLIYIVGGMLMLGAYGVVVNTVTWDFSKLLGVYVAFFATMSVLAGWLVFRESIPPATWLGLALIIAGGMVIQFSAR